MATLIVRRTLLLALTLVAVASCGERETPEQKLARLRYNHEIVPTGYTTVYGEDGSPSLLVDLRVANQGSQKLDALTVLVEVRGPAGGIEVAERVTLDLSDLTPGTGTQIAARLPGIAVGAEDEVSVLIESGLDAEQLRALPEFEAVAAGVS